MEAVFPSRILIARIAAKIAALYLVLCLFFLFFFLRLCVAIFLSFLLRPQGTLATPWRGDPEIDGAGPHRNSQHILHGAQALVKGRSGQPPTDRNPLGARRRLGGLAKQNRLDYNRMSTAAFRTKAGYPCREKEP